jgi:hypothetical protein
MVGIKNSTWVVPDCRQLIERCQQRTALILLSLHLVTVEPLLQPGHSNEDGNLCFRGELPLQNGRV